MMFRKNTRLKLYRWDYQDYLIRWPKFTGDHCSVALKSFLQTWFFQACSLGPMHTLLLKHWQLAVYRPIQGTALDMEGSVEVRIPGKLKIWLCMSVTKEELRQSRHRGQWRCRTEPITASLEGISPTGLTKMASVFLMKKDTEKNTTHELQSNWRYLLSTLCTEEVERNLSSH